MKLIFLISTLLFSLVNAENYSNFKFTIDYGNDSAHPQIKYIAKNILRNIKPKAWEMYDLNSTINELYGNNKHFKTSEKIHINVPTFSTANFKVHVQAELNVKSIAILQEKEDEKSLVSLYYPENGFADIIIPIKSTNNSDKYDDGRMNIIIITETSDNHLFINKYYIDHSGCNQGYDEGYLDYVKSYTNKDIRKVAFKSNKQGLVYLYALSDHPMISYRDAYRTNKEVDFISHLIGELNNNKIFDLYTSEYVARRPLFKVGIKTANKKDILKLTIIDIHDNKEVQFIAFTTDK